ncbi:DUF6668 family protein [Krasilnikovia sp. MM14-A1259]|uniref:DUF6668 family protein n=1 Tax=Krasilnikovia sp. MM14-A1259 TaxID=3373539 RepID=UPI0038045201
MRANTASPPGPEEGPAAGGMSGHGSHPPRHLHSLPTPAWTQPTTALPSLRGRASMPAGYDVAPGTPVSTLPTREPAQTQPATPGRAARSGGGEGSGGDGGPGGKPSICWVAAHGGAGATTLAAAVGGVDVGCRWPDPFRDEPARVLLVARTNAGGMRAASQALNAIREGRHPAGMAITGLVLVADAPGRLPRDLVRRIKVLRACIPVWRVPWVPQWRLGKQADRLPSQVAKLGALIPSLQRTELR